MNLSEIAFKREEVLNDPLGQVHLYTRPYHANERAIKSQTNVLLETVIAPDFDTKTRADRWFSTPLQVGKNIMSTALSSGFMFNSQGAFSQAEANDIAKEYLKLFTNPLVYSNHKYRIDDSDNFLSSSGYAFFGNLEMGIFVLDDEQLGAFWVFDKD